MSQPALAQACAARDELARFRRGDLPTAQMDGLAEHLHACGACQTRLEGLPEETDGLLSALRHLQSDDAPGDSLGPADSSWQSDMAALEASSVDLFAHKRDNTRPTQTGPEVPDCLGEYRILSPLGRGGMGAVYKAKHARLDKVVAIKVLTLERWGRADAATRFQREMRAVGKLNHPNIVSATDAGEADGVAFLVMEFIAGIDLARLIKRQGPVPAAEACELARQAALGLQYAHDHGLVHRDVKPSNLMLTPAPDLPTRGLVKVADLGLALLREGDGDQTGEAMSVNLVIGSLDYIAPEQAEDAHQVDHRADLYSLGCTLYELLTGKPPFSADGRQTRLHKINAHANSPIPALRDVCPRAPAGLSALVARLLAKDPSKRHSTAAELAAELQPFCAGADLASLLEPSREIAPHQGGPNAAPPSRRKRTWGAIGGCLAAALAASVLYIQTDRGTVEIDSDDGAIEVRIEQKGNLITILDHKQNKQVRLRSGVYEAKLAQPDPDVVLSATGFALKRGGKEVVKVRRQPPPSATWPFGAEEAQRQQAHWARYLGTTPRLTNSLDIDLMLIPPGEFLMLPGYHVKLSKPFLLAAHEVTVGQFRQFVEASGYQSELEAPGRGGILLGAPGMSQTEGVNWRIAAEAGDDYPVSCVTFYDAQRFCAWLSERENKTYRLPTEAEWNWACRAGSDAAYPTGNDPKTVDEFEWHNGNSGARLHPVGKRKQSPWGLYDMNGNAVEWCRDWVGDSITQAVVIDPAGPPAGTFRVLRGGSFHDGPFPTTLRGSLGPHQAMTHTGFRVCREL